MESGGKARSLRSSPGSKASDLLEMFWKGQCRASSRAPGRMGKCGERGCQHQARYALLRGTGQGVSIGWRVGSSVPGPGEPPFLIRRQLLLSGLLTVGVPPHDYVADDPPTSARHVSLPFAPCEMDIEFAYHTSRYLDEPRSQMKTAGRDFGILPATCSNLPKTRSNLTFR